MMSIIPKNNVKYKFIIYIFYKYGYNIISGGSLLVAFQSFFDSKNRARFTNSVFLTI